AVWLVPLVIAIVFHEVAHGLVARRLGDPTAAERGRLTLNPLKHVDPFGTVILPLILAVSHAGAIFGWAKPVPVDYRRLRNPRPDMGLAALAGPGMNLILPPPPHRAPREGAVRACRSRDEPDPRAARRGDPRRDRLFLRRRGGRRRAPSRRQRAQLRADQHLPRRLQAPARSACRRRPRLAGAASATVRCRVRPSRPLFAARDSVAP